MPPDKPDSSRKTYGLRLNKSLYKELQHLSVDEEQWVNDLVEEAIRDLLKKYKDKGRDSR
ncbi:hypothetical protein W02_24740 [Nitrospira sp. KM1]|nr:hypothetical protein W02_24740 [Nitrospira sp. KM1]